MAERVEHPDVTADMRIEIVKRELNQGALAGFDSAVTDYAARLVIAALDSFDEAALRAEFRRGFELGEANAQLLAVAAGRKLAADAIRAHGIRDEDLPPGRVILLDVDLAAKIAQGDTDG